MTADHWYERFARLLPRDAVREITVALEELERRAKQGHPIPRRTRIVLEHGRQGQVTGIWLMRWTGGKP